MTVYRETRTSRAWLSLGRKYKGALTGVIVRNEVAELSGTQKATGATKPGKRDLLLHYLALAREFRSQHLFQKAEATLKMALEKSPHNPTVLTALANLYLKMNIPDQALRILNRLLRAHPRWKSALFLRGKLYQRRHQIGKAILDFRRALTGSMRDLPVLNRLIPLLLERKRFEEVQRLIQQYRSVLHTPARLLEWEAGLLKEKGRLQEAVEKMREAVIQDPGDRFLLKRYLQLLIQAGLRDPLPAYQSLQSFFPDLAKLSDRELAELEIEYLIHKGEKETALKKLEALLTRQPDSYYHRKRRAFLLLDMDREKEAVEELVRLFRRHPEDVFVRSKLEHYFVETRQLSRWKSILKETLLVAPGRGEVFGYLKRSRLFTDWLAHSQLTFAEYQKEVQKLPIAFPVLADPTYARLPFYALETLVHQIALHDRIPTPQALWQIIQKEKEKKGHVPPFQLEDLEVAYPVWLFGIQFYYLFKEVGECRPIFVPSIFQRHQIAVVLEKGAHRIQLDIGHLIDSKRRKRKPWIKKGRDYVYRWPGALPVTTRIRHIPFYRVEQARQVLQDMMSVLTGGSMLAL